MAQWTSAVGPAQLARQLAAQQSGPAGPGTRRPPAYRALADGIRLLVLEGRVPVAARLPAERELAVALAVSRTTVAAAYEALRAEGFLESRRGARQLDDRARGQPAAGPRPRTAAARVARFDDRPRLRGAPAPEPWLSRGFQGALEELPPTRTPTATTPRACPRCAAPSPTGTRRAASPRCPSRSW